MSQVVLLKQDELNAGWRIGGVVAAAAAAAFVVDRLTPFGVLDFVLYIPLCLVCLRWAGVRLAVVMTGFCSALIVAGLLKSPTQLPVEWAVANHVAGLVGLWLALWAGVSIGHRTGRLLDSVRQAAQEQKMIAEREQKRAQQLKQLSEVSLMLSGDSGEVLEQIVRTIGDLFGVRVVCLSEIVGQELVFKAVYVKGEVFRDAGGCSLAVTPCATVEGSKDLRVIDRVMERFPQASFLKDHEASSYCGFPALDSSGRVVAVTCLLDDKPHEFTEEDQSLLRIFGQRIAVEIERARHLAERVEMQRVLEDSERQFRILFNGVQDGILAADVETRRLVMGNEMMCQMLGVNLEGLRRMSMEDLHPPDRLPALVPQFEAMARGELTQVVDVPLCRSDGTQLIVDIAGSPITINGRLCNLGVFRDITGRRRLEGELRSHQDRLAFLLSSTPAILYSAKASGDYAVTFIAPNVTEILGYSPGEFVNDPALWGHSIHPDDREQVFEQLSQVAERESLSLEYRFRHKNGTYRWMGDDLRLVRDSAGSPVEIIGSWLDITDRKQAETERTNLASVLEASLNELYLFDSETLRFSYVNRGARENLGYSMDRIRAMTPIDLKPEFTEAAFRAMVAPLLRREQAKLVFATVHKRADGTCYPVEVHLQLVEQDQQRQFLAVIFDITERKAVETALRESEERYSLAVRGTYDGIWDWHIQTGYDYLSPRWKEILGYRDEELPNEQATFFDRIHPEDVKQVSRAVAQHLEGQAPFRMEFRLRHKDGGYRWVLSRGEAVCDAGGRPYRMVGSITDITERKQTELALRENETRLNEAQHLARIGNWELDLVSNHLIWSDEIFRIFEIDQARFSASYEAFLNAIHPDDRVKVNEAYTTSVKDRVPYDVIHRLLMPDGRIKYVQERCETEYDEKGRSIRSRGTVQDITERRLAELHIERALREKEVLLREMHHRVKNNLQLVSSLMHFQAKKISNAEDLAVFRQGQDRLKSMILVHERLYRSGDLAHVDFGEYVRVLAASIRSSYAHLRGNIEVRVEAQPVALSVEVALPAGLILNELLTNAFKYAFADGCGTVLVQVVDGGGRLEMVVADTGVGVPAGFDIETASTFGLQLVRGLAAQIGGTFTLYGDSGTTARLTVPLSKPSTVRQ